MHSHTKPLNLANVDATARSKRSIESTDSLPPHKPLLQIPGTECNEVTSSPILVKHHTGHLRLACRCHWPTLFGQVDLFEDCNVQHACDGGKGVLVNKFTKQPLSEASAPIADIHDYECSACDRCNVPGPDPHTGLPSCLPRPFNDRDKDMCLYDVDSAAESEVYKDDGDASAGEIRTIKPMLYVKSQFVDGKFQTMFTDRVRDSAWVPNPCAFDSFTGARLNGECELRKTQRSNIAYCAPMKDNIMTAVMDDTYLVNNNGRYPNACFRFTSNEAHVDGYVIEYFLRQRTSAQLPSPVVSMLVPKDKVLRSVLNGLGLKHEPDKKMLLFTQPEPPSDVSEFPHPFNRREGGVAAFTKEMNHWLDELPAKCATPEFYGVYNGFIDINPILYNCSAPVQRLVIPACSKIGNDDRSPSNKNMAPRAEFIGDQTEVYAKSTVACVNPKYDSRFPIVPNYNVSAGSTDAAPSSAILFFDKSDRTVYPHWKEVGATIKPELKNVERYVREALRSLPNET